MYFIVCNFLKHCTESFLQHLRNFPNEYEIKFCSLSLFQQNIENFAECEIAATKRTIVDESIRNLTTEYSTKERFLLA